MDLLKQLRVNIAPRLDFEADELLVIRLIACHLPQFRPVVANAAGGTKASPKHPRRSLADRHRLG